MHSLNKAVSETKVHMGIICLEVCVFEQEAQGDLKD